MLALRDLRGLDRHRRGAAPSRTVSRPARPRRPAGGVPARFLVLGSASPEFLQQTSESLAGRIYYHDLGGFDLDEVGVGAYEQLWLRGGFPRSFLAGSESASAEWRRGSVTLSDLTTNATVGTPGIANASSTSAATLTVNTANVDTFGGSLQDGAGRNAVALTRTAQAHSS